MPRRSHTATGIALAVATLALPAAAADTPIAVAANFTKAAEEIAAAFAARTGDTVALSFGATGQFYAQISQGAPFTVLLAADDERPAQALAEGLGVAGTAFTYAVGRLVLYSSSIDVTDGPAVLRAGAFQHIAIAEPKAAPYGAAAMEVVEKLGLVEAIGAKIVTGENVTQAQQFIDSGNAEIGFVALSQVIDKPAAQVWHVPPEFYAPIRQDAVLLEAGETDTVARAFLEFLKGDEAKAVIEKYGYAVPAN